MEKVRKEMVGKNDLPSSKTDRIKAILSFSKPFFTGHTNP